MKPLGAFVIVVSLAAVAPAFGELPRLRGLGVDETLDNQAVLAPALDRARLGAADLPVFVRLLVRRADLGPGASDFSRLDARLDLYGRRNIPVVLTLVDPPTDVAGIDAWRPDLRALAERTRGRVLGYQVGDRLDGAARPAARDYAYLVKFVAVQVRSVDSALLILQASLTPLDVTAWQEQVYREDVAAYVDGVPLSAPPADDDLTGTETALTTLDGLVAKEDGSALVGVTGLVLPGDGRRAAERLLWWHLMHLGGRATFTTCVGSPDAIVAALKSAMTVKDVVGGEVVTLDEEAAALKLSVNGQDVTATLPHHLLYNMTTSATYLLYWAPRTPRASMNVSLHLATVGTPVVRDAGAATMTKPADVTRDEATRTSTARVDVAERPLLLDFNFGAEQVYALRSDAAERAIPTVEEILFRYQQAETAQAALVQNYMATARVSIHFQPTALDSYDVVLENRFFSDSQVTEWEELSFSLNGTRFGRNRPPFPLLQPEKVLSLPLTLRLNRDYVYHYEGTGRIGDRLCYVVRFDPIDETRSLYRGKVWIDQERYVRLKLQSVQTRLTAPVASNEEVQTYEPVGRVKDQPIYLFSTLTSRQIMQIAGRNLLVERDVVFSNFRINAETFQGERDQARASNEIMYRDTDRGLRHLVKRGNQRVVSDQVTTNAKALAIGVTFDPSYDSPVPLFGIDYANFNFLNRGLQLGFLFSGVLGAGNLQKANIAGTKFDVSVDFFGIAVKSNDLVYDASGERPGERLLSRKASTGVNLGYQASAFQKITVSSHVEYDQYLAEPDKTASDFIVPVSTPTVEGAVNYEYRRSGYSFLAGYGYFRRATWQTWGTGADFDPATRSFTKYSVALNKDFYFGTVNKIRLNASYYGGQREDRFSMYRFGLFDEARMRGVPSAGLRFSEVGMLRASYSFNVLNLYRLALFVDHARGRTPLESRWVPTTGIGAEVNFPGPKTTLWKLGVGKGFLPQIYKGSGSLVIELMVFKPI
ncbi:MAG TPA: sigma-E factor regulatory protein RseB domain-containing protein [Vicinamibacterales bacterium]